MSKFSYRAIHRSLVCGLAATLTGTVLLAAAVPPGQAVAGASSAISASAKDY